MAEIPLKNVGNLPKGYKYEPGAIWPQGAFYGSDLILKFYTTFKEIPIGSKNIEDSKNFIQNLLDRNRLDPYIGLGYTILSKNTLNIFRWYQEDPQLLMQTIYEYEKGDTSTLEIRSVEDIGALCLTETIIVAHEKKAWENYIDKVSKIKGLNKENKLYQCKLDYINNTISINL